MLYGEPKTKSDQELTYMPLLKEFTQFKQKIPQFLKSLKYDPTFTTSSNDRPFELINQFFGIKVFLMNFISLIVFIPGASRMSSELRSPLIKDIYDMMENNFCMAIMKSLLLIQSEHKNSIIANNDKMDVSNSNSNNNSVKKNDPLTPHNNTFERSYLGVSSEFGIDTISTCILILASVLWNLLLVSNSSEADSDNSIDKDQQLICQDEELYIRFIYSASYLKCYIFKLGKC